MHQIKEEVSESSTNRLDQGNTLPQNSQGEVMFGNMQLFLGMSVEALDSDSCWYPAKITGINEANRQVLVHFEGFNPRHDKWYDVLGNSIRPMPDDGANNADETITKPAIPSCPLVADEVDGTVEKKRLRRKRKSKIGAIRKKHSVPKVTQDVQVQKEKKLILAGLSFAFEGNLKRTNEKYVTRLIEHNGGECKRYITASVKYVIVGDDPHREKLRKITNYGIKIITEEDFINFAKKLAKPKGRAVGIGRATAYRKDETNDSSESRGNTSDRNESTKNSSTGRDRMHEKDAEASKLKILSVPLYSTTRADRSLKRGINGPEKFSDEEPSISHSTDIEFGKVNTSMGDFRIVGVQNCLSGLQFGNEGQFGDLPLAKLVYKFGGKYVTNVTFRLDYLIVGKNPRNDRVKKAVSYGVSLIDEAKLIQLIKEHSAKLMNEFKVEKEQSSNFDKVASSTPINSEKCSTGVNSVSKSLTMEQGARGSKGTGSSETPGRYSTNVRCSSGSYDVTHQDHLYNQPYRAENASSNFNSDQHNRPNHSGLHERNYLSARHDHSFGIIVNHGDQANHFIQKNRSGKITRASLAAENEKGLILKKPKKVSRRKLLTIHKQAKKVLLSDGGSAKSLRIVSYTQGPNVTLPHQRPSSASEVNHEANSSSQNEPSFGYLTMNIQCPENCGAIVCRNQIQKHFKNECKNVESECYICGFKMLRKDIDDHISRNIVKHMTILGKELKANKSLQANSAAENMQLLKKIDALQGRLSSLEKDNRNINDLCKRLEKQNQVLVRQNEKMAKLCNLSSAQDHSN